MKKKIVIFIQSDPRESHRACEGIRIALGLASGGHQVEVLLAKNGPLLLEENKQDYVDEANIEKFLAVLSDFSPVFFVDERSVDSHPNSAFGYRVDLLSKETMSLKVAAADCFLIF